MIHFPFLILAFFGGAACFGPCVVLVRLRACADEAVSDNPALWWREQIELAKGRKAARELRKEGTR